MNIDPLREMKLFNFLYSIASTKEAISKEKTYEMISNKMNELYSNTDNAKREYLKVIQSIHRCYPLDSEGKQFLIMYYHEYYDKMG